MRFKWTYQGPRVSLQTFLRRQGFSLAQLKQLKFHGGFVFVNKRQRNTAFSLRPGDVVFLQTAPEVAADAVVPYAAPLAIVYEDEYLLVVDKPAGVPSIPDVGKSPDTMANRVKAYLLKTHAESAAIHVVTRLDRDTSGLMLFAKSGLIHSLLDAQLHTDDLQKEYLALVAGAGKLPQHGWLVLRIGQGQEFYMKRAVTPAGKRSVTEFETLVQNGRASLVRVQLHTGRTHQIRVHFAAIGHPLFGDTLYGGPAAGLNRQALHCAHLHFWHPILKKPLELTAPLPNDMLSLENELGLALN
ncbi:MULTISPECIES: RluA family pseudouridine synthase [unclassified Lacticaseibacillus]|uniref:RluA family pseudouridine synthase n=1 Tax=unclassified Lacticaseibacillus TaxID=2759744 RepID=UPI0019428541|nr:MULTISPECIES: RluA family pseudouridine synthase [unclassified Lacticaseibacillus]